MPADCDCAVSQFGGPYIFRVIHLKISHCDRFIRFPSGLLDALLRARLSATQWRVVLWVVRRTLGWNRLRTRFSWYRIAKELGADRAALYRAGVGLLKTGTLVVRGGQ